MGPAEGLAPGPDKPSAFWIHKRQQSNNPGPLHGVRQVTLLLGCQPCQAAGKNLAPLCDEFLEQVDVFVINRITGFDR